MLGRNGTWRAMRRITSWIYFLKARASRRRRSKGIDARVERVFFHKEKGSFSKQKKKQGNLRGRRDEKDVEVESGEREGVRPVDARRARHECDQRTRGRNETVNARFWPWLYIYIPSMYPLYTVYPSYTLRIASISMYHPWLSGKVRRTFQILPLRSDAEPGRLTRRKRRRSGVGRARRCATRICPPRQTRT